MENKALENISVRNLIREFNKSDFRKKSIPMEVVTGWPCLQRFGKTLCLTLPYFSRKRVEGDKVALYPILCSVTFPVGNPGRIIDFTLYPIHKDWEDVDFEKPAGVFRHEAIKDVTKEEYAAMQNELFEYMDEMASSILKGVPFEKAAPASKLFQKLMEPGLYPYYLRVNKKFYTFFYENGGDQ